MSLHQIGIIRHHGSNVVFVICYLTEIYGISHRVISGVNFSTISIHCGYFRRYICIIVVKPSPSVNTSVFKIKQYLRTLSNIQRNGCTHIRTCDISGNCTRAGNGRIGGRVEREPVNRSKTVIGKSESDIFCGVFYGIIKLAVHHGKTDLSGFSVRSR